jgi:hypothetical protein
MDIPAAAATPWLVLGLAAGLALALLVGLTVVLARNRRARSPGAPELPPERERPAIGNYTEDDLPGFLESPPGSASGDPAPREGWPALSAPAQTASVAPSAPVPPFSADPRRGAAGVLVAMALATLLLVAAAAAVAAAASRDDGAPTASREGVASSSPAAPSAGTAGAGELADASVPPGDDGAAADLTFGGVVLERHAVGVTATYPVVGVTWDGDRAVAHVELPTFNCLRDQAPGDPLAAGCSRSVPEYADLDARDLQVHREGGRLLVTGAFPTYLRPNGSPPVWTGRRYELVVTAEADRRGTGWRPARGQIELGSDRAPTTDAETNRIRFGS